MNPNHCPNSALLIAYASGSLTEAFSLVVASHLSFCQECQEKVSDAEMIGGALIDELEPSNVDLNSLDQILSKLDNIAQDSANVSSPSGDVEIPQPLWNYINSPLDDLNWKFLAPVYGMYPLMLMPGIQEQFAYSKSLRVPRSQLILTLGLN